jgi:hypothetical protein
VNNDQLSTMATIFGFQGRSLCTELTVNSSSIKPDVDVRYVLATHTVVLNQCAVHHPPLFSFLNFIYF